MPKFRHWILTLAAGALALPASAAAQGTSGVPGFDNSLAQIQEHLPGNRFKLTGAVELSQVGMKFYADEVEYFGDTKRLVATGNVLLIEQDHQIAAERADFNAETKLGTFYKASGFASLGAPADASAFGTLQPDVQFFGETLEKIGPDTYLLTHGGFTTCAQANPRWEMTSGTLKLRIDHYAFLRNVLLKVKGVPALYLPVMYYPLSKDNRSTGFLMPSYGSSILQGQILSNAFFWAINRSQDATIQHDWYSRTGQQVAGEYRYLALLGSGNVRTAFINERPTIDIDLVSGKELPRNGRTNFSLNGSLAQGLGRGWTLQGRTDYSSNLVVTQTYSTDINKASSHTRSFGGSVTGSLAQLRLTGTYDRNENFATNGRSGLRGNSPRINVSRPDRTIAGLPVYTSVGADYVHLINQGRNPEGVVDSKSDFDRLDVVPIVRYPFTRLPFLSMNSSLTWRNTFWSDSYALLPNGTTGPRVDNPISRRFFEMSADFNGPTLVRIWDAPNSTYAQRFKHTIEPFLQIMRRTAINDYDRFIQAESIDTLVGDATTYGYGFNSRLYAKNTADGPLAATPREIIGATIRQTYSTNANSIRYDQTYRTSHTNDPPSHFTPVSVLVRAAPTTEVIGTFRTEFDGRYSRFKLFGADGTWRDENVTLLAGWSQNRFQADGNGKNVAKLTHYVNSNATVRFKQNRFGVIHNFNWDVQKKAVLQQRIAGYYNAQCCGFTAEYQTIDLKRLGVKAPVEQDSRFHFSVTLAGIGNVSNIFGGLGGTPNR